MQRGLTAGDRITGWVISSAPTGTCATRLAARSRAVVGFPSGRGEHEQCFVVGCGEPFDVTEVIARDVEDVRRRRVPYPEPDRFGRRAVQEGELTEIGVLRHDHIAVLTGPRPDLSIRRRVERDLCDVATLGVLDGQLANEVSGQVLIEQQSHAGVERRRSRIAANSIAARTCSSVSSGKSLTI